MKDLYLVRHAVAFARDPDSWPDDSKRPLTPEGEESFRQAARRLARMLPAVDLLLSSQFARAWRTAEVLQEEAGWPDPVGFPALEPDIPPEKVLLALETHSGPETIALVGHRPCLHEFASYLLTGREDLMDVGLKKGGVMCLRFSGPTEPGTARLRALLTPRMLLS